MSLPSNFHRSTFSCSWPSQSGHPKTPSQQNLKQLWAQWANCQRLVVSEQCQGCVTLFQSCLLFQSCPKAVWHCLRAVSRLCHIFSEQCQCCVNIVSELLIVSELSQGCLTLFQSSVKAVSHCFRAAYCFRAVSRLCDIVSEQCQDCVTLFQRCLLFQSSLKAVWHCFRAAYCFRAVSRLCHIVSEQCQGCVTSFQSCLFFQSCLKAVWHCFRAIWRLCHIWTPGTSQKPRRQLGEQWHIVHQLACNVKRSNWDGGCRHAAGRLIVLNRFRHCKKHTLAKMAWYNTGTLADKWRS